MDDFPRTTVGGVSLSRMIIGTNWFNGYSHTSEAKDKFVREYQTRKSVADILEVFFRHGIDTIMTSLSELVENAAKDAEDRTGRKAILVVLPDFNFLPGGKPQEEPERVFDVCRERGATFCMPHQRVTDALIDRMHNEIRDINKYTKMIRERGMVPGLSTHMPEAVVIADKSGADVETYIQLYNSVGFLMQVEVDWVMRIIKDAKKPVMTIKPLAAGRILPPVGQGGCCRRRGWLSSGTRYEIRTW